MSERRTDLTWECVDICRVRNGVHTMRSSIGLWTLLTSSQIEWVGNYWHCSSARRGALFSTRAEWVGNDWSLFDPRPGLVLVVWILGVVLVTPTLQANLLTWSWHRKVVFISFILHIEISTIFLPRFQCILRPRARPSTGNMSSRGSTGGGCTAGGPTYRIMTQQSSFHIIHSSYWG